MWYYSTKGYTVSYIEINIKKKGSSDKVGICIPDAEPNQSLHSQRPTGGC